VLNSEELMEPKSKALNSEELIQEYRKKGNLCFNNKNFQDAITHYKKGLSLCAFNILLLKQNLYQQLILFLVFYL
jgi:hypothetical protein